jgi:hypothetical protein
MLLIFGRYQRTRDLPPTTGPCAACRSVATIYWRRHYKTGHFFFFPLFSFSEQHEAACGACGSRFEGRYPVPPPPLPFLDRLGFLVPVGFGGAGLLGVVALVAAAIATAPPPKPPTAASIERTSLEAHLITGQAFGESELERKIAAKIFDSLQKDEGLAAKDVGVAVRVKPGPTRRVIVLAQVLTLRDLRPKARRDLVDDARAAIVDDVEPTDLVTVAVKGTLFYGVLSQGPEGSEASVETDELVPSEHVERAFDDAVPPTVVGAEAGRD